MAGTAPVGARVPRPRRGAHVLARHLAGDHRASRVGCHERLRRRAGPVHRATQRRRLRRRPRGLVGAAHDPPREDRRPGLRALRVGGARVSSRSAARHVRERIVRIPSTSSSPPSPYTPCAGRAPTAPASGHRWRSKRPEPWTSPRSAPRSSSSSARVRTSSTPTSRARSATRAPDVSRCGAPATARPRCRDGRTSTSGTGVIAAPRAPVVAEPRRAGSSSPRTTGSTTTSTRT